MNWNFSDWHRWDPHIHAPGTALEDKFDRDWDGYFNAIAAAAPKVTALGITDYLSISSYEEFVKRRPTGHAEHLVFVFPNIEFRLSPQTTKGNAINLHLLVNPEDPLHCDEIHAALGRLTIATKGETISCTRRDLIRLGRIHSQENTDENDCYREGVGQFKFDLSRFLDWMSREQWLRRNSLIAIAGGNDGLAGLRRDSGFRQYHDELVRDTDLIFSAQPSDRKYYAGVGPASLDEIVQRYGMARACLHGSDAHDLSRVLNPDLKRYCWIKAAPTFDGLRQVLLEPLSRVYLGETQPDRPDPDQVISRIHIDDPSGWFKNTSVELTPYLTAIIGEKGSGKTALADLIAVGAGSWEENEASFLTKASGHLTSTRIQLEWASGRRSPGDIARPTLSPRGPELRYLSQQFVERLCSSDVLAGELVREVERVVFDHIPEAERLNAIDFDDLRRKLTESLLDERLQIRQSIVALNEQIEAFRALRASRPKKLADLKLKEEEVNRTSIHLADLMKGAAESNTQALQHLRSRLEHLSVTIATLQERVTKLDGVQRRVERYDSSFREHFAAMQEDLLAAGIERALWDQFRPSFSGDPAQVIMARRRQLAEQIRAMSGSPDTPSDSETLHSVKAAIALEEKKLQLDTRRLEQVTRQQMALTRATASVRQLSEELEYVDRVVKDEMPRAAKRRVEEYLKYFDLLKCEKMALQKLYEPLRLQLAQRSTGERDLDFEVVTSVDTQRWAAVGEDMLDLRRSGRYTHRGALEEAAVRSLSQAWRDADALQIGVGLHEILEGITEGGLADKLRQGYTPRHVADWLFSVDHIELEYGLKYRNIGLKYLSPGTRGIVLLILYLAVDTLDTRPLVIDQPEENLDNASIYSVLVDYVREAKQRRQIVIVTHNPNLVVNTDAEEVVVATGTRSDDGFPRISYSLGPLETIHHLQTSSPIKVRVCEILEGGRAAFKSRERRYKV